MSRSIKAVEYCYVTVPDVPGAACEILEGLATSGVNLQAFHVIPGPSDATRLALFPVDMDRMRRALDADEHDLSAPQRALLIQGDDELGVLVEIHRRLYDAGINIASSSGLTDGKMGYGYLVYLRPQDVDRALLVLEA